MHAWSSIYNVIVTSKSHVASLCDEIGCTITKLFIHEKSLQRRKGTE